MVRILAIEASTKAMSVALLHDEELRGEVFFNGLRKTSEKIIDAIESLLVENGEEIGMMDAFAVSTGPGSFTGLRVGMGTAKGFALSTGKPLIGVPTLEALAHNIFMSSPLLCTMIDARKGEVYCALFRFKEGGISMVMEPMIISPHKIIEIIKENCIFLGDALQIYGDIIKEGLGERALIAPPVLWYPRASQVGLLALKRFRASEVDDPFLLKPVYLRPPDAELKQFGSIDK